MYDDPGNDDLIELSSSEDIFEDTDQSSNADSEQSSSILKYWQEWQPKGHLTKKIQLSSSNVPLRLDVISGFVTAKSLSFEQLEEHYQLIVHRNDSKRLINDLSLDDEKKVYVEDIVGKKSTKTIPEDIFKLVIGHSFPQDAKDIQLYSCLANGTTTLFEEGEQIYNSNLVKNVIQIGYLVNANVERSYSDEIKPKTNQKSTLNEMCYYGNTSTFHVTICVDRQRITSTKCTCGQSTWCHHVIATCLYRIYKKDIVEYRVTMFDSVNDLNEEQLKKLFQLCMNALPIHYITTGQKYIDELRDPRSKASMQNGAPDPTDGGHQSIPIWSLNERSIHHKITAILIKFIKPKNGYTTCDIQMLNNEPQPPVACEYKIRQAVLKAKQPAALWNFFGIVYEMFNRQDENATHLLHMITVDCIAFDQIIFWWYQAKLLESGKWHMQLSPSKNNRALQPNSYIQMLYQAAALFDEIVRLWKIAALNPKLNLYEKERLTWLLQFYHKQAVHKIWHSINKADPHHQMKMMVNFEGHFLTTRTATFTPEFFPGFYSALEACHVDFHSFELKCVPLTATCFNPTSDYIDICPNIPLLEKPKKNFFYEIKNLSVTTAILWDVPKFEDSTTRKQKSKKKKRRSKNNHGNRQTVSNQNSGSGSAGTVDYSGGEDSLHDEYVDNNQRKEKHELELDEVFALTHAERELFHVRFDACDSLSHHGYSAEAIFLALKLAKDMLQNVPNCFYEGMAYEIKPIECTSAAEESSSSSGARKSKRAMFSGVLLVRQMESCPQKVELQLPRQSALSTTKTAVEFLERAYRLIKILLNGFGDNEKYEVNDQTITVQEAHKVALEVGTIALSLQRYAAPMHQLEIYLNYLECEILEALRTVKLTNDDTHYLRKIAMATINRCRQTNTDILPPTMLALFVVETLTTNGKLVKQYGEALQRNASDNELGYQAALNCLDMKLSYVEEDYPMLFECFRKQRRTLAFALIVQFKDDISGLGLVLDKLLDPTTHRMYDDHESNAAYFLERDQIYRDHTVEGKRPIYPWRKKENKGDKLNATEQMDKTNSGKQNINNVLASGNTASIPSSNVKNPKNIPSLLDSIRTLNRPCQTQVTPHATEALAHFYSDLANEIHQEAGGNNNNIMFNNNNFGNMNAMVRIHRNLHMCSFLIGMYAVGVHNLTVRNWSSRTHFGYNVGWLHTQALDIGKQALEHVRRTWPRHFTATEVASLADKASHRADHEIIHQGALLAVSALYKAHLLTPNEVNHRLRQCREFDSLDIIEEVCIVLEKIGNEHSGFCSQALFQVARYWYETYEETGATAASVPQRDVQAHQAAQYQLLGNGCEQYQRYAAPFMYYNQQQQQQYSNMAQYPAPLHPSHSAPNLLPQNQVPYPYNLDTSYSYYPGNPSAVPSYNNPYYPQRNSPACRSQRSMPTPNQPSCSNPASALPPPVPYNNYQNPQQRNSTMNSHDYMRPIPAGDKRLIRLLNAYRVGILAIKSQRMAENDKKTWNDSISAPQYEDDLAWLLDICNMLGILYVNSFFEHVEAFVTSPKVLYRFVLEAKKFYGTKQQPGTCMCFPINQHAFVEQLPIAASMGMYQMPPHPLTLYNHSSSSGSCSTTGSGNNSPSCNLPANNLFIKIQADMKHIRNAMCSDSEQTIRLTLKCIEMFYYAVYHRLNFSKLQNADANSLRLLLADARHAFLQIPDGLTRFEGFIRHWKIQRESKKRVNVIKMKDIFDEFLNFKDMDIVYQSNYSQGLTDNITN
uniref:SWIM-type domain-containing protein n=1 Tax=Panagrolaimus superbus TaxID=310955 RepID=A0A914Z5G6_9BILA